ncbi:LPXTG cell wall anchor domain-containing protein [Dehalococcoidia bacterium]|nr:LPXTG cell wall anchor domain-containing protein [Dehalococcoidia bacterium]MCL0090314.1 LPXTG cell wall anchor domain-containing protein [Dehalococcoidia bacterium]MCL0097984.1 LPXTG cell wall anchor domain-containing protein [Dehalococcoidia bacterium]
MRFKKILGAIIGLAIAGIAGLLYWRKKRRF